MAALGAVRVLRAFGLATLILSLSAVSGMRLLRAPRSEWDGQSFRALRAHAYNLFNQKEFKAAFDLWDQGYRQALAHHDTLSAMRFLNNIGTVHFGRLEYRQAIDAFTEARKLAVINGDRVTVTVASANLCSLYMQIGDMAAATAAADAGLRKPVPATLSYRSRLLVTRGLLASRSHHPAEALGYFREAVRSAETFGDDAVRFEAWSNYAYELLNARQLDAAEIAALKALHIGHLDTVREVRPPYLTLARIYRARGDARTALALIGRGLAIPPRSTDRQIWNRYFLFERARVRLDQGHPAAALPDLREARSYARHWREAIAPSDALRSAAEFWLKGLYDAYIDAAIRTHSDAEAFLAVEEERSASLLQMLADAREASTGNRWPASYPEDLARLRAVEIRRVANPSPDIDRQAAILRVRISEAEASAHFLSIPAEKDENILSLGTLHGVQRNIGPHETVLSLHSRESASFLWALTRDHLEMHRLRSGKELATMAERFRHAVEQSAPERDRLGAELYTALFGNLSRTVEAKSSWIVTSDDSLSEIPFEALVVQNSPGRRRPVYLVERHETHRIPSAFVLADAPLPPAPGPFLGVGDGIYNTADERWTQAHPPINVAAFLPLFDTPRFPLPLELPRLVSSTFELESSAAAWNSRTRSIFLTGPNASRPKLVSALLQKPAVIHIAAHVLHPQGKPGQALIDLGLTPSGASDVLTTNDIARLDARGALVVVSGCSSAAADSPRGTGIMGLTRAWLLAGARAVVGSRWPVEDDTGDLFRSFYAHLAKNNNRHQGLGSALQQAQLQMLRSDSWRSDPRYWGAFYLMTKD